MKMGMYAVKDTKAQVFNTPFFQHTHGSAERAFEQLIRDPQSLCSKYPKDYDLYFLGSIDDESGKLSVTEKPQHIVSGEQLATGPN